MPGSCIPILALQGAVSRDWLTVVAAAIRWYVALCDPRPDLATPARRIRLPYAWWWW